MRQRCSKRWTKRWAHMSSRRLPTASTSSRHNLIRMTLYDELRPARRRQLAPCRRRMQSRHCDAPTSMRRSPELARHFHAAGDIDRAIDYATRAGQRAEELLAFEDAVQFFQAALDAVEQRVEHGRQRYVAGCCSCWARRSESPMTICAPCKNLRRRRRRSRPRSTIPSCPRAPPWLTSRSPGAMAIRPIRHPRTCWSGHCSSCL